MYVIITGVFDCMYLNGCTGFPTITLNQNHNHNHILVNACIVAFIYMLSICTGHETRNKFNIFTRMTLVSRTIKQ